MITAVDAGNALITIALALLALLVVTPIVKRGQGKATIELLRSELAVEHDARLEQESRCDKKITDLERRHDREVGELRGQLALVHERFAKSIGDQVGDHVITKLRDAGVI